MRGRARLVALAMVVAVPLAGAGRRQEALAITGAIKNPANGHYYKLISSTVPVDWKSCKANAEALKGYLATITSAAEDQWLSTNILAGQAASFLGGTDLAVEGTWVWVTGEVWSYSNFSSGQPDNYGGFQHYLVNRNGTWDDQDGGYAGRDTVYNYVVEWDGDPNPPVPPSPPAAPSDLTASVSYGNPIFLRWKDNSSNEEAFEIERRTAGTSFARIAEVGPNSTAFEDPLLGLSTEYTYRVRAMNWGGVSGYSNEASATSSPLIPAPRPPTNLIALSTTPDAMRLAWTDNSIDEIGFEVHRRLPDGRFEYIAATPANASSFTDTGLAPDTSYDYAVRSVSLLRASFFTEVSAATLPTLQVTALRADLKDSPKFGKDSLKVQAMFDFLPASPDGLFDPLAEGITIRAGTDASPVVMTLPGNLDTWKVKGTKATWKSARGSTPKYTVQVDLEDRLVKASAAGLELAAPPANPMRVSVGIGNDAGTARGDWEAKKPGYFRLR